ncbi:MAG: DUF4166 domain-containing protein [Sphingobium sp.]|nr:DUF4166 domain-containing protein [Sphingobium sp.]
MDRAAIFCVFLYPSLGTSAVRRQAYPTAGFRPAQADGRETWTRDFSGRRFRSQLSQRNGWLVERFGPLRFAFDLHSDDQGLRMVMRRWWLGPLPLPKWLAPRSNAQEWAEGGRFHFDVPIALPLIGQLVHYRGWLEPAPTQ